MPSSHPRAVIKKSVANHKNAAATASPQYTAKALADQIHSLPGLSESINFDHFAGYLDVSDSKKVFYW